MVGIDHVEVVGAGDGPQLGPAAGVADLGDVALGLGERHDAVVGPVHGHDVGLGGREGER